MKIDDIVHHARLELPDVLDAIIVQAIAAAASDFCTRTRVWDEIQDPFGLVDGVNQYDMEAPLGARVLSIANVWANARELVPVTMAKLVYVLPNWQTAQSAQPVYFNAARDWSTLTVYPIPMQAQQAPLTFRAQYAPTRVSTTLPDFLVDRFFDALMDGAKARLMLQSNVPWSNPAMAAVHQQAYEAAVAQAHIDQLHERVPAALTIQPVRFG